MAVLAEMPFTIVPASARNHVPTEVLTLDTVALWNTVWFIATFVIDDGHYIMLAQVGTRYNVIHSILCSLSIDK